MQANKHTHDWTIKQSKEVERGNLYLMGAKGRSLGGSYPKTYDPM